MALTIKQDSGKSGGNRVLVDRRLYLTGDGKRAVEEGDPEGRQLLCSAGKRVHRSRLEELGVKVIKPKAETKKPKADAEFDNKSDAKADDKAEAKKPKAKAKGK